MKFHDPIGCVHRTNPIHSKIVAKKKINPKVKAGCGVVFVFGLGALFGLIGSLVLIFGVFRKSVKVSNQS